MTSPAELHMVPEVGVDHGEKLRSGGRLVGAGLEPPVGPDKNSRALHANNPGVELPEEGNESSRPHEHETISPLFTIFTMF